MGSSETTREKTYNLMLKKKWNLQLYSPSWLPQHILSIDKHFVEWFIGFSEGDGSFSATLYKNKSYVLQEYYRHSFIINQKEPQVLYKIRTTLGFGTVKKYEDKKQGTTYFRYVVSDLDGIERLIHIFNGNLILTKTQNRFKIWLDTFNLRPSINNLIPYMTHNSNNLSLSSAWLSGFIDAEGCFNSLYNKDYLKSLKLIVDLRFIMDQKNESQFFKQIKFLFNSGRIETRNTCDNMERFVLPFTKTLNLPFTKMKSAPIRVLPSKSLAFQSLFKYLDTFPLRTIKNINYIKFQKIWIRLNDSLLRSLDSKSFNRLLNLLNSVNQNLNKV